MRFYFRGKYFKDEMANSFRFLLLILSRFGRSQLELAKHIFKSISGETTPTDPRTIDRK